jgi:hypothetical protein
MFKVKTKKTQQQQNTFPTQMINQNSRNNWTDVEVEVHIIHILIQRAVNPYQLHHTGKVPPLAIFKLIHST